MHTYENAACDALQMGQHQSFKGFHDHRRQGDGPVVIQSSDGGFLGNLDDGGAFEAGEDFTQLQRSVEDPCEDGA